jgi:sigma-B regulation protein RsbU (phosphoserine phosphatase)
MSNIVRTLLVHATHPPAHHIEQALQGRGHEVVCCEGAGPALAAIATQPFDLVIVDLAVAGIDFREFSHSLRARPWGAWCEILVISASGQPKDIGRAVHSGADDYLIRADDPELLGVRLTIAERHIEENAARRQMIAALTVSEDRFRDLLETAPDAIFRVDREGRIRLVNGQAERMTGYTREELVGQPVELLVPEAQRAGHVVQRRRFGENPMARPMGAGINLFLRRKDGSELPVDICLGYHRADDEEYTIAAVRDMTERRRLEDELRLAKEAAEHAYNRIRRDLEAAARLQRALLPTTLPAVAGIRFAWQYHPYAGLAGDGLNVFLLDDDHIGLYLLDVSGHGVPAALLSVALARLLSPALSQSSFLRVRRPDQQGYHIVPPAEVARQLNEWLLAHPAGEQFFTFVYGVLDIRTWSLRFVTAGHHGLMYAPAGSEPALLRVPGYPVGCLEGAEYEESALQLRPGDRLFLYSDGMDDALNPAGEHFGQERLRRSIGANSGEPIEACTQRVFQEVLRWADQEPQDDLSVLALAIGE